MGIILWTGSDRLYFKASSYIFLDIVRDLSCLRVMYKEGATKLACVPKRILSRNRHVIKCITFKLRCKLLKLTLCITLNLHFHILCRWNVSCCIIHVHNSVSSKFNRLPARLTFMPPGPILAAVEFFRAWKEKLELSRISVYLRLELWTFSTHAHQA